MTDRSHWPVRKFKLGEGTIGGESKRVDAPPMKSLEEIKRLERQLLAALKQRQPELRTLLDEASSHWGYEDNVYRFYHHSFKVYGLQHLTLAITAALRALLPDAPMNADFERILADGTDKTFTYEANQTWNATTRPLVEAFFHARFFLEMALKYADELDEPPQTLPSGWAALLYLYNLR